MKYCRKQGKWVYGCDHASCNGQDPREQQGETYCHVAKRYVYSCDHYDCNKRR